MKQNKNNKCFFCNNKEKIILDNDLFCARWDDYPVSRGHALIFPKKHIVSFLDLKEDELIKMFDLLKKIKSLIDKKYNPDGYNIGTNEGETAGRTINHLHIHLIPRYSGDIPNPKGGIRNIIPGKGDYLK